MHFNSNTLRRHTIHTTFAAVLVSSVVFPAVAMADEEEEHFDVWFRDVDGQIVTGSRFEDFSIRSQYERVFGGEFGEDPLFPFNADEPGFQAFDFAPGTSFRVNATDALGVWNGGGFDLADETMGVAFEGSSFTTGVGPVNGFTFDTDSDGDLHDHFELTLNGASGNDPDVGIYLLSLSVGYDGDPASFSDPFFFVMNLGEDEASHEAAIDWVNANLVPTPGGLLLLGAAGLMGRRRRD